MATNHDAVAALPISGSANKTLLRNTITARMPYVLSDSDDATDLVAVDPDTGSAVIDIIYLGRLFHYDPTDTTTAHDGISCLVTLENRRYKLSDGADVFAYSVLDNTLSAPPVSPAPSIGDSYLIAAGATGAWAGKSNYIGIYTRRGWEFINYGIGRFVYVESEETYYHRDSGGTWLTGLGNQTMVSQSVPLSSAINFGKRLIVEDQTTTAPPVSPTVGTAYIIGPAATGAWAGLDGKIAICEVAGAFVIYTPTEGWAAYDKNLNGEYRHSGSVWESQAGAIVASHSVLVPGTTTFRGGNTYYVYSDVGAPGLSTDVGLRDTAGLITHTARRAGNAGTGDLNLIFEWTARVVLRNNNSAAVRTFVFAIMIDSQTTALDWCAFDVYMEATTTTIRPVSLRFEVAAPDNLQHTYQIWGYDQNVNTTVESASRRRLAVMERA